MDQFGLKNDLEFVEMVRTYIKDGYICDRLNNMMGWYIQMAHRCKKRYYIFQGMGIVLPATVVVINAAAALGDGWKTAAVPLATLISSLASVAGGILGLSKWHENWINYRKASERLKTETSKYIVGVEPYGDEERRDTVFIMNIESIAADENAIWGEEVKKDADDCAGREGRAGQRV